MQMTPQTSEYFMATLQEPTRFATAAITTDGAHHLFPANKNELEHPKHAKHDSRHN